MKVRPVLQQLTWNDSQSHLDKYGYLLQKIVFYICITFSMNISIFCSLVTLFVIFNAHICILCTISLAISYVLHVFIFVQYQTISIAMTRIVS